MGQYVGMAPADSSDFRDKAAAREASLAMINHRVGVRKQRKVRQSSAEVKPGK